MLFFDMEGEIKAALAAAQAQPGELVSKVGRIQDQVKQLEKELARFKAKLAASQGDELAEQACEINGVKLVAAQLEGADNAALRETLDKLKDKLKTAAIVLASVNDGKVALIAGVTADVTAKVKAGELVNFVAQQVGGKGGGRPDMAQAGGTQPENLAAALAGVKDWVSNKL
jgi:alanyl-tRNA synthetase